MVLLDIENTLNDILMFTSHTWWHCLPTNSPTRPRTKASGSEGDADAVALAHDGRRQGRPDEPPFEDSSAVRGRSTTPGHQAGTVPVCDRQVVAVAVEVTKNWVEVKVKCSELQVYDHPLFYLYQLGLLQPIRIVVREVW